MSSLSLLASAVQLPHACVRFAGMPDMPPGMGSDPRVYASGKQEFTNNVGAARLLVRAANISWTLVGTAGEQLVSSREIREQFGGVIFVGDSQIREIAWAALQMLTPGQAKRFSPIDKVFAKQRQPGASACVPQSVGKTGFTASCDALGGSAGSGANGGGCHLHSPFANKSHAESMRRLLLTKPHEWNGRLSVSPAVCSSDFFVSYQATWGAMPVLPATVPPCLHPGDGTNGAYALRHQASGRTKPILWVMDGCGLHEMEFCDARRWALPQHVLPQFPPSLLQSGTVIWQTVGAGFLMKAAKRFKGECSAINADQVAQLEESQLAGKGVRIYNYSRLALQYAPLMFDAIHFTYYWVPCAYTFPEMARLVAQLGFQQAVNKPVEVCPPNTPLPAAAVEAASAIWANGKRPELGMPGGLAVSLAQGQEQSDAAYKAAFKMAGPKGLLLAKQAGKALHKGGGAGGGGGGGKSAGGGGAGGAARTEAERAAAETASTAAHMISEQHQASAATGTAGAGGAGGLASAIHAVASQFGGKKKMTAELEAAITRVATQYHAHD